MGFNSGFKGLNNVGLDTLDMHHTRQISTCQHGLKTSKGTDCIGDLSLLEQVILKWA